MMDENPQLPQTPKQDSVFNKRLFRNISLLSSLLMLALIIMMIVHYYEQENLEQGESSSIQLLLE